MNLRLKKPYMKSPTVRRWQELCEAMLVPVGECGPDGVFGPQTEAATRAVQGILSLPETGRVSQLTFEYAQIYLDTHPAYSQWPTQTFHGVEVHDCRGVFSPPKNYTRNRTGPSITGIMLHQTACVLGENPLRWAPINAHIGVTRQGKIILMHHFWRMIWHGHAPSVFTVGVEFDGNFEGRNGVYYVPGGGPHTLTTAQLEASHVLLPLIQQECAAIDSTPTVILAHRQSSSDRMYDPGWEIWRKVGLPWQTALTYSDPKKTWGSGRPIPTVWDPASNHQWA